MIELEDGTEMPLINITNTELHQEQLELTESLCSESELVFGACEASVLKFTVSNVFLPMKDKWLTVKMVLDGNSDEPFQIGRYKVFSDVPTADRTKRNIVAYDAMYDILNADLAEWYNEILPNNDSKVTMKQFRTSLISYFGLQQENITLINDDMIIEKTMQITPSSESDSETEQTSIIGEAMSGKEVISSICEINGCFGHIGRDGKFHYIYLQQDIQGLYPSNDLFPDHAPDYMLQAETGHLYPQSLKSIQIGKSFYISCSYEDYIVKTINKLQIRQKENDIGAIIGTGNNCYVIEDNFLVYGKSLRELDEIGSNIYKKIKGIIYRPFDADIKGNPCLEVGDSIRIPSKYELIESYVLKRTLKGIQALRDNIEAGGEEYRTEKVNSIRRDIVQLKGKSNTLTRTIEEAKSEIEDVESGLSSRITQLVDSITVSVTNGEKEASITLHIQDGETSYDVISDKINFKGLVSFENLENDGETIINGGNITTGKINCDLLNGGTITGQIFNGGTITGSDIEALENFYIRDSDFNKRINIIHFAPDNTSDTKIVFGRLTDNGYGSGTNRMEFVDVSQDKSIELYSDIINSHCPINAEIIYVGGEYTSSDLLYGRIYSGGRIYSNGAVCPDEDGGTSLGLGEYRWSQLYSKKAEINTSDKNEKHDIKDISEKYEELFFKLKPKSFLFNEGDRIHIGIVAQELEESMNEIGITNTDLAAFCRDVKKKTQKTESGEVIEVDDLDETGQKQYRYGVRYSEFIMLNTHMVQKAYKKMEQQQNKINNQQEEIDSLRRTISFLIEKVEKMEEKMYEQDI